MGHRDDYKGRYKTFEHETDTKELFLGEDTKKEKRYISKEYPTVADPGEGPGGPGAS